MTLASTDCDKCHRLAVPPREELNRLTGLQTVWNLSSSQQHTSHSVRILLFMHQMWLAEPFAVLHKIPQHYCFMSAASDKSSFGTPARMQLLYGVDLHDRVPPWNAFVFASSLCGCKFVMLRSALLSHKFKFGRLACCSSQSCLLQLLTAIVILLQRVSYSSLFTFWCLNA